MEHVYGLGGEYHGRRNVRTQVKPRSLLAKVTLLAGLLVAAIVSVPVGAHAEYRSSVPANGATVATPPAQVVITFSEETSVTKSDGMVMDAAGTMVSTGWSVDLNERTKLTIPLKPNLPNGIYTVSYTSLSEDGHQVDGSFIFTVDPAAANLTKATTSTGGGAPWLTWAIVFGAVTLISAAGFFLVARQLMRPANESASTVAAEGTRNDPDETAAVSSTKGTD
jgi:methionine-rich copper-binding protein CopC